MPRSVRILLAFVLAAAPLRAADEKTAPPLWMAVGPSELLAPLAPLAGHREGQGLATHLVASRDVRAALDTAPRRPSWLLLVGDDLRGAAGGEPWLVRSESHDYYRWREQQGHAYATDAGYADFDGDGFSDIPVGRIPARTPAAVAVVVGKILAYERRPATIDDLRVVAWAGAPGYGGPIDTLATSMLVSIVQNRSPRWADAWLLSGDARSSLSGWPPAHAPTFLEAMRGGSLLNAVMAHGDEQSVFSMRWRDRGIGLHVEHGRRLLRDGEPLSPLVLVACSCATFDAADVTLAEELLLLPGGPVATVGATIESHPLPNYYTGVCLLEALAGGYGRLDRLGDLWLAAQEHAAGETEPLMESMLKNVEGKLEAEIDTARLRADQRRMYALLGDPATRLPLPAAEPLAIRVEPAADGDGWRWHVDRPADATRVVVGWRALAPGLPAPVPPDADEARRRVAFAQANARNAFAPLAELGADEPWTGTVARRGLLRAVATGAGPLRVGVVEIPN